MLNNPLSDILTRIQNGQKTNKSYVYQPKNKLCLKFLKVIYQEGYIKHYSLIDKTTIKIWLNYYNCQPLIHKISFFSRRYSFLSFSLTELWKLKTLNKLYIFSTTKGLLSGGQCKKKKIGGKLMCIID
jgi:small subunit ribosomal protein S8